MDKYLNRSRMTAMNSIYDPSYLYSSAKPIALSRYNASIDITPTKLDSIMNARTAQKIITAEFGLPGEETLIRAELDRKRAIQTQTMLTIRDEVQANQDLLNIERQKQRVLIEDLAQLQLIISDTLKLRDLRIQKQLSQFQQLDIRSSQINRQLRDSQFRLDAHDAMIRGLQNMALTGK